MRERKGEYILIRKRALHRDGWTGGNYTQYIADRDDGSKQPCKGSMIPFVMLMIGLVLLELVACVVFLTPMIDPNVRPITNWDYVYKVTVIGFIATGIGVGLLVGNYRLMKAVQWRSYDGKRRHYYEPQPLRPGMNVFGDGAPVTPMRKFVRSLKLAFSRSPR